jgi:hypothetical protein
MLCWHSKILLLSSPSPPDILFLSVSCLVPMSRRTSLRHTPIPSSPVVCIYLCALNHSWHISKFIFSPSFRASLQQVKASAFSILSLIPSFWSSAASSRASYLPSSSPLSFFLNRPQKHNSYDITPKTQFFLHFLLFSSQLPAPPPQKGTKGLSLQTKLQKYKSTKVQKWKKRAWYFIRILLQSFNIKTNIFFTMVRTF